MKTTKNNLKTVTFFLATLILLQGCSIYKSASLKEASQASTKVRIKTYDNRFQKFQRIEIVDNKIYGIKHKKEGETVTVNNQEYSINRKWKEIKEEIKEEDINKIQIKDKTASYILTAGVIGVIYFLGRLASAAATWGF